MQLYSVPTGYFKLDGGAMFGVVPKTLWSKVQPADENNLCTWAMRCLLIEDAGKLVLVDNGIGNKQDTRFFSHYYLHGDDSLDKSLAAHGFHRDDITDVFLTHLHFDHCGGSIVREGDQLLPAFRKATYWSHSRHWKWATEPNDREKASFLKENILPIQASGQLKFVDEHGGGDAVLPGLSVRLVNGHTDAMMLPQVACNGRTVVFMADLLPSIHHLPMPWIMAYDMFPLTTLTEKKAFLEEAVTGNYVLFFEHDPAYECCEVTVTNKGIRSRRTFTLAEL
ncbi:MAG TPA: MBL fold metallo-hydrolase [Puia sp.]|nr:MBL fold metallo-hydrolase [Puia sp.]